MVKKAKLDTTLVAVWCLGGWGDILARLCVAMQKAWGACSQHNLQRLLRARLTHQGSKCHVVLLFELQTRYSSRRQETACLSSRISGTKTGNYSKNCLGHSHRGPCTTLFATAHRSASMLPHSQLLERYFQPPKNSQPQYQQDSVVVMSIFDIVRACMPNYFCAFLAQNQNKRRPAVT
jgi:hypothetical protein